MGSRIPDLRDKRTIAQLNQSFKDIEANYPQVMRFLEYYCGFNTPGFSYDAGEIAYRAGKRDVILCIKTLMRDDILPGQIANFFKENL